MKLVMKRMCDVSQAIKQALQVPRVNHRPRKSAARVLAQDPEAEIVLRFGVNGSFSTGPRTPQSLCKNRLVFPSTFTSICKVTRKNFHLRLD